MGQIDQLLRHVAGAPVRTVLLWRSRGISWKVITSNLLPVPSLSIKHHQLLPSRAGNGQMDFQRGHSNQTLKGCILHNTINKTWPQILISWHQFKTWPQNLISWHQFKTWPQKLIKWHQFKTWPQKLIKWHQKLIKWHQILISWHQFKSWHQKLIRWHQKLIRWHQKLIRWHQFKLGTKN